MQVGVFFDPATEADAARHAVMQLENAFAVPATPAPTTELADDESLVAADPATVFAADAVTLHQETDPHNRSRRLLEALTAEPLTFTDLGPALPANDDGSTLTNAQVRAVYRNLKRTENRLLEEGAITAPVVQTNFNMYDEDGGGRYYLAKPAVAALDRLLGR